MSVESFNARIHLIALMPRLAELRVFDNSFEANPSAGRAPRPRLILRMASGRIVEMIDVTHTPQWAKALVAAAVNVSR